MTSLMTAASRDETTEINWTSTGCGAEGSRRREVGPLGGRGSPAGDLRLSIVVGRSRRSGIDPIRARDHSRRRMRSRQRAEIT